MGAMMMGRATGEVIVRPPRIAWIRQLIVTFHFWLEAEGIGRGAVVLGMMTTLLLGAASVALLLKLLRR
jgi:hypothetical protein